MYVSFLTFVLSYGQLLVLDEIRSIFIYFHMCVFTFPRLAIKVNSHTQVHFIRKYAMSRLLSVSLRLVIFNFRSIFISLFLYVCVSSYWLCVCVFMDLVACNKLIDWLIDWVQQFLLFQWVKESSAENTERAKLRITQQFCCRLSCKQRLISFSRPHCCVPRDIVVVHA